MIKDILSPVNNKIYFVLLALFLFGSCDEFRKQYAYEPDEPTDTLLIKKSESIIGKENYWDIYKQMNDSISYWTDRQVGEYKWCSDKSVMCSVDSVLCVNEGKDKIITCLFWQDQLKNGVSDELVYFYGAKIHNKWCFFEGASVVLDRKNYQKDIHIPSSPKKMHELAMKYILCGYLKKDTNNNWEINDEFFSEFSAKNWVPFAQRRTNEIRFCSCENIDNEKDYLDCNYRKEAERERWVQENCHIKNETQAYDFDTKLPLDIIFPEGKSIRVLEYVDGGEWCVAVGDYSKKVLVKRKDISF